MSLTVTEMNCVKVLTELKVLTETTNQGNKRVCLERELSIPTSPGTFSSLQNTASSESP